MSEPYVQLPLHHCLLQTEVKPHKVGITLLEDSLKGHINIKGNALDDEFQAAVNKAFGVGLPGEPLSFTSRDKVTIYWLAPDEWLAIVDYSQLATKQHAFLGHYAGHCSVVDVSGGQTLLLLSGDAVQQLLQKACVYDVHPDCFPVGKCVQTNFAKATALIAKRSAQQYELVIRRSFADYIYYWLADAACEYGFSAQAVSD